MKASLGICIAAAVVLGAGMIAAYTRSTVAEDNSRNVTKHWYAVVVTSPEHEGRTPCRLYGSSPQGETQFPVKMVLNELVLLEDLRILQAREPGGQRIVAWTSVFPESSGRIYLNPRHIVSVEPLTGDPLELIDKGEGRPPVERRE
jgi:hypothetical protein